MNFKPEQFIQFQEAEEKRLEPFFKAMKAFQEAEEKRLEAMKREYQSSSDSVT